jgi:transcription elongation factor GreA
LSTDHPIKLLAIVGEYTESLKNKDRSAAAIREINKFVKYFQEETDVKNITPAQMGTYAEIASKNSLTEESMEGLQAVRKLLLYAHKTGKTSVNLATHFRVRKSRNSNRNEGSFSNPGQQMTQEGYDKLSVEKEDLESNRPIISNTIHNAAEDGDVRENAPLEAAREQQGREEARIKEIESMQRSAVIVDKSGKASKVVGIGTIVQVSDENKKKYKYTLVSPSEADPSDGKISDKSPLGKALLGKRKNQKATFVAPNNNKKAYEILSIS